MPKHTASALDNCHTLASWNYTRFLNACVGLDLSTALGVPQHTVLPGDNQEWGLEEVATNVLVSMNKFPGYACVSWLAPGGNWYVALFTVGGTLISFWCLLD